MSFIHNLLNSSNIETRINEDALKHISFKEDKILFDNEIIHVIFSGETDELFGYRFGKLPYRSLRFEYEKYDKKDYQTSAIVAYPSHEYGFTRITEYTKLPYQDFNKTIIVKEYPLPVKENDSNEPYCNDRHAAPGSGRSDKKVVWINNFQFSEEMQIWKKVNNLSKTMLGFMV